MKRQRELTWTRRAALAHGVRGAGWALASAVACGLFTTAASADPVEACLEAHSSSQSLRKESKLLEARQRLLICAADACPQMVRNDCAPWLDEVNGMIPSVVFVARKDGRDLTEVAVFADGAQLVSRLDGRPVEVDPGPHKLRFETPGSAPIERDVVISVGQRGREESVDFGGAAAPAASAVPPPAASAPVVAAPTPAVSAHVQRPVPASTWIFCGVGLAALTVGTVFEVRGMSIRGDLDDQGCKPYCSKSDVQSGERSVLAGDIALGVGVVSLAAAAFTFFTRPEAPAAERSAMGWRPRLRLDARSGGAAAALTGTF